MNRARRDLCGGYPRHKIIIAADDDAFDYDGTLRYLADNVGIIKATAAARAINGLITTVPPFPQPRSKEHGLDYNDFAALIAQQEACHV